MPKLTIDNREVEVPPGATILDAAGQLEIPIPTMCFLGSCTPSTSCLVCMVKLVGPGKLVPACATVATEGMIIQSETPEVHQIRRSALELLLSDHLGDCLAPCMFACPAQMNIPRMLRRIVSGDRRGAIETIKSDIALPAVLGRICPAPCEKACRRKPADGAVAICRLKRYVADIDLASGDVYSPTRAPSSNKRVAIIGAGPTGLSAAYYLVQRGHHCTLFEQNELPGGRIRNETTEEELPRDVLDAEIIPILELGVELRTGVRIDDDTLARLAGEFDALMIACGTTAVDQAEAWGLAKGKRGIHVAKATHQTDREGIFAGGGATRGKTLVIRSLADGKEVAVAIDQYLCGRDVIGTPRPFNSRIGRFDAEELAELVDTAAKAPRQDPAAGPTAGFDPEEATRQAARCLHCDCRALDSCKLREHGETYGADPRRYHAKRRRFHIENRHAEVIFEPGKCIDCGLCIEIASTAGEPLGLTFVGRGFDVRVSVPLDRSFEATLQKVASECAAACPTAALTIR